MCALKNRAGASKSPIREFGLIPLEQLELREKNARRREITADLDELAYSMKTLGLQQPIVVQQKNGKFEIIIGQRIVPIALRETSNISEFPSELYIAKLSVTQKHA